MTNKERKPNKSKLLFGIASSMLFTILGVYLYSTKSEQSDSLNPTFVKNIGIICIVFFGITCIIGLKKLLTKSNKVNG
ncbi:hypothetical protein [Flavobacterium sp.]|uniref:hypothetical protein n=1 Tax=Flavobacterium sp. TaxID=239 RepID=UPI002B4AED91|nr:hypothetical protein [Flavobacterium sp.]HLF53033.1 hypothetical protein [Flavobacterium sp.]